MESCLNYLGVLIWDFKYWSWPHVYPIMLFAYLPSALFLIWLHDLQNLKTKQLIVASLLVVDVVAFVILGPILQLI